MQNHCGQSRAVLALYELLNPVPLGFFVAGWIFDIIYINTYQIMWTDAANWLIAMGLLIAITPRMIKLVQVCFTQRHRTRTTDKIDFLLYLLAIIVEIANVFVHSRDAYAVVPLGVILSTVAVLLLVIANIQLAVCQRAAQQKVGEIV